MRLGTSGALCVRLALLASAGEIAWACTPAFEDCSETRTCPHKQKPDRDASADASSASGGHSAASGGNAGIAGTVSTSAGGTIQGSGGTGGVPITGSDGGSTMGMGGTAGSGTVRDGGEPNPDASDDGGARVTPCDATHFDCDDNPKNGCETNVRSDAEHCGDCKIACSNAGTSKQACTDGVCKPTCDGTHLDCDDDGKNGCETDSQGDAANCGACKHACSKTNASAASCVKGVCSATCSMGFGDCGHPTPAADDGCETKLTLPTDCGACGHDCGGGTCTGSKCDPLTLTGVIDGAASVLVDDTYIHWTQYDSTEGLQRIQRAPIRGGQATTVSSSQKAGGLASDGKYLYWCNQSTTPDIRRQLIGTSGDGTIIIDDPSVVAMPCPIAVDGTNVYWADYQIRQVFKTPKDGSGHPDALTPAFNSGVFYIGVDGPNVYYGGGSLAAISGADVNELVDLPSSRDWYMTFDATYVYYVVQPASGNAFVRLPKAALTTGQPQTLTQFSGILGPMAVDAQYLYYSLKGDGIYRLPKAGGTAVRIATDSYVTSLVATGTAIYWSNGSTTSGSRGGAVRKLVP